MSTFKISTRNLKSYLKPKKKKKKKKNSHQIILLLDFKVQRIPARGSESV